jgi:hypothetical protein
MITRRNLLVTAACVCAGLALVRARAAEASARSFVEAIYASYIGKDSKGISLESDAAVRRYFESSLAALILKDRREARGEIGKLGSDPFIDAQDWEIDSVDVAVRDTGSDKASATVSFKNLGERQTVVLALVRLKAGWRISDITWDRNGTLRGLLTK